MPPQNNQYNPSQQFYGQPAPTIVPPNNRRRLLVALILLVVVVVGGAMIGFFLSQRQPSADSYAGADKVRAEAVDSLFSKVREETAAKGDTLTNEEFRALYDVHFETYTDPDGGIFGLNGHKEELLINSFYYGLVDEDTYELCTKLSSGKLYCQQSD